MTVSYRFIGKGTTDANGVAHITEDANGDTVSPPGYVGVGAGEIDVVASVDKPISSGSVVSQPYEVLDCYKYDGGTTANHNDIWTSAYGTLTRSDEYSTLKESATNDGILAIANIPYTDYHVEVDIFQVDGTANRNVLQILNNDYSAVDYCDGIVGEWKHFSLDKQDLATNTRVRIITGVDCTELRFKNFQIYPI